MDELSTVFIIGLLFRVSKIVYVNDINAFSTLLPVFAEVSKNYILCKLAKCSPSDLSTFLVSKSLLFLKKKKNQKNIFFKLNTIFKVLILNIH